MARDRTPTHPRAASKLEDAEEELVARAAAGDRVAFDVIVARHSDSMKRAVARFVVEPRDAADLVQIALEKAYAALPTFRRESSLRTWLHRIATNTALNHVRANAPRKQVQVEDANLATTPFRTTRVSARGMMRRLTEALDVLPERQRTIVEMRLLRELSFAEIAEAAGCSEDAAKMTYHRAMERIREMLGDP
ncbi:MAG: sigma-70 family RNA polymerase sigma factor [Deltaproteobacteria bacterium]|nr:sigma-70 family RNA polymerase sigma factor [Deltaproteobacteria bacterium]